MLLVTVTDSNNCLSSDSLLDKQKIADGWSMFFTLVGIFLETKVITQCDVSHHSGDPWSNFFRSSSQDICDLIDDIILFYQLATLSPVPTL